MRTDPRSKTCVIIRRNGEYLAGRILGSKELRWSIYAHEAVRTRDRAKAEEIAKKLGGITMLYNPITMELRVL